MEFCLNVLISLICIDSSRLYAHSLIYFEREFDKEKKEGLSKTVEGTFKVLHTCTTMEFCLNLLISLICIDSSTRYAHSLICFDVSSTRRKLSAPSSPSFNVDSSS